MRKSCLSVYKQHKLINHFVAGVTARVAATLVNVNKTTATFYFQRLRKLIAHHQEQETLEAFDGEIEVDESYFGSTQKGKRGHGASGKIPVFDLLKHGDKVHTQVISDAKTKTLFSIIRKRLSLIILCIVIAGVATMF